MKDRSSTPMEAAPPSSPQLNAGSAVAGQAPSAVAASSNATVRRSEMSESDRSLLERIEFLGNETHHVLAEEIEEVADLAHARICELLKVCQSAGGNRDAEHYYQLSMKYLERANKAEEELERLQSASGARKYEFCRAPSATMTIGSDGAWLCRDCGASFSSPECRYLRTPDRTRDRSNGDDSHG